jgi:HK97 family phage prohead protease
MRHSVKSAPPPNGDVREFVMSDDSVDRAGDVIEQSGWDLSTFQQKDKFNPIALFNHRPDYVIGSWADVRVEGNRLIGRFMPAAPGTSEIADSVRKLIEQGILRATSVGFEPKEQEPLNEKANAVYGPFRFKRQSLLECSVVSVPANPQAVAVARSLNISNETISRVFGEHAEARRRDWTATGEHAVSKSINGRPRTMNANITPSQRIEYTQHELNDRRDRLAELNGAEVFDVDAAEKLNSEIDGFERALSVMKAAEARMGLTATTAMTSYTPPASNLKVIAPAVTSPAINRKPLGQPEINGLDLWSRCAAIGVVAHAMRVHPDLVREQVFGNDEITKAGFNLATKAASAAATTTVTGWAAELVQPTFAEMMPTLLPESVYGPLSAKGLRLTFGRFGAINIPTRAITPTIAGSFVGEGQPIPVRQGLFTTQQLLPKAMKVISTWTREMDIHSIPQISALIREAIQQDTSVAIDSILLDTGAKTSVRPAGLRNGISGLTPTAGGGFTALVGDLKALIGAVNTATNNNLRNPVWLMNPVQKVSIGFIQPTTATPLFPFASQVENDMLLGYPIIDSGTVPAGTVIFMDAADYVSATDDSPKFDVSDSATLHMEDTTPLNIGTAGSPATVAAPSQSMFQTDCIALRMVLPMDWLMRRASLAWVAAVTW